MSGFTIPSGVTYQIISSPTSCYSLPTPTASLTAVQVNDTGDANIAPYVAYLDSNGAPSGEFLFTSNGTSIIYDFTNPAQIGLTLPDGNTAIINSTGIYLFAADCSVALAFTSTVEGGTPPSMARRSSDVYYYRRDPIPFEVDLTLYDQCGTPDPNIIPTVYSGATACSLSTVGVGEYTNACTFPDVALQKTTCTTTLTSALNRINNAISDLTALASIALAITLLSSVVTGAGLAAALTAVAAFLNAPAVIIGIALLSAITILISHIGADNIASGICGAFFIDYGVVLSVDTSQGYVQLDFLEAPPSTPLSTALTISDAAAVCESTTTADTTTASSASPTATAGPCPGGSCGGYPRCGANPNCFCGLDPGGNSACVYDIPCEDLETCETNEDCGGGSYICLVANCCNYNVCLDTTPCGLARMMERGDSGVNGTLYASGFRVGDVLGLGKV